MKRKYKYDWTKIERQLAETAKKPYSLSRDILRNPADPGATTLVDSTPVHIGPWQYPTERSQPPIERQQGYSIAPSPPEPSGPNFFQVYGAFWIVRKLFFGI